mgnify:CR=1 FL=1
MEIRRANLDDIETLVGYWREVHPKTVFAHLMFDEVKLASVMRGLVLDRSGASCFLIAEKKDGTACGILVGQIDAYSFSNDPVAKVVFYWVHEAHRKGLAAVKLMLAFREWAQNRRVREIVIGVTSGQQIGSTDRMLKKMGGRLVGGNYSIVLTGLSGSRVTNVHQKEIVQ